MIRSCNSRSHGPIKFKDFFKHISGRAAQMVPLFLLAIFASFESSRLQRSRYVVVVVVLLFYVHGKHLRSCRDGQLT